MTIIVWIFALLTAAIHIVVFVWEAFLIGRPSVHEGIFGVPAADVPAVRLWAFGVGFYNLFIGCGLIVGVIAWIAGNDVVGRTLVTYLCLFAFLSGIVLLIADRMQLGREEGKRCWRGHRPGCAAPHRARGRIVVTDGDSLAYCASNPRANGTGHNVGHG
jgi:putative membrane protein